MESDCHVAGDLFTDGNAIINPDYTALQATEALMHTYLISRDAERGT